MLAGAEKRLAERQRGISDSPGGDGAAGRAVVPATLLLLSASGIVAAAFSLDALGETFGAIVGLFFIATFAVSALLGMTTLVLAWPRRLVPPSLRPARNADTR